MNLFDIVILQVINKRMYEKHLIKLQLYEKIQKEINSCWGKGIEKKDNSFYNERAMQVLTGDEYEHI